MAIPHAHPGQPVNISAAASPGVLTSTALFKSRDLEVIRLLMGAGKGMPPHRVPGEITIQCVSGHLEVGLDDGPAVLQSGQILYLEGDAMHSVTALTDACALVTISLPAAPTPA